MSPKLLLLGQKQNVTKGFLSRPSLQGREEWEHGPAEGQGDLLLPPASLLWAPVLGFRFSGKLTEGWGTLAHVLPQVTQWNVLRSLAQSEAPYTRLQNEDGLARTLAGTILTTRSQASCFYGTCQEGEHGSGDSSVGNVFTCSPRLWGLERMTRQRKQSPSLQTLILLLASSVGLQLFSPSDHFTVFGAKKEHSPSLSHPSPLLVPTVPSPPHFLGAEDGMRGVARARY